MIKPEILSDEKLDIVTNDRRKQLEIQNDYCYKEMLRQFRELVDKYMANGRYKAPWDDVMVNCLSGDVEYIWKQLKEAL